MELGRWLRKCGFKEVLGPAWYTMRTLCSEVRSVAVSNSQHLVECPETCPVMTSEFVEKENVVLNIKQKGSGVFNKTPSDLAKGPPYRL